MPPKRRRRFQGLYYHSSPPKVMPNGQAANQNGRKRRDTDDFSVKLSTIRIWMHEKEIGKLTRILWAGQGNRLCQQASNNGRVKRFLAAVPHVMNAIKDLHQAVIDNNLETVQANLEPPVPPMLVTCKDANGLNIVHKAAGLGHTKILEYLVSIWPEGAHETDITGKTALHWAASAKNNMRCYALLTQAGCNEEAVDYKMKTPSYYRHKPHEIERAFLVYVPEAPRVSPDSVTDWEALSDDNENAAGAGDGFTKKLHIKIPPSTNGMNGRSQDDSIENTSELDTNDGTSANGEEDLSKADADATPAFEILDNNFKDDNDNDNGNGTESEAENIARAVSGDSTEAEAAAAAASEESAAEIETSQGESESQAEQNEQVNGDEIEQKGADNDDENAIVEQQNGGEQPTPETEMEKEKDAAIELDEANETEKTEAVIEEIPQEKETENEIEVEVENEAEEAVQQDDEHDDDEINEQLTKQETLEAGDEQAEAAGGDGIGIGKADKEAVDDEEDDDEDVIAPPPVQSALQPSLDLNKIETDTGPGTGTGRDKETSSTENGVDSPTSSLAIEGFVQGASEDYTVQSQTAAFQVDEDARIQQIIESGDMEQLAEIVLNGEGGRLVGLTTKEPEIQAFLNNVPSYMEKIRRVHDAARDGSLMGLQQALDRRKFAIAKDDISPNGATPLHVAVLFGHSDIVRYLASRFPETTAATDNDGRTALHYAATIKDNGHFYNVLTQLGSYPKAVDKLGHTPEFYLDVEKSKDILTYSALLNIYGAEELENQLLNDQGQAETVSSKNNPIFKTEQGKYLADSLADPLIKALTEIANKRPRDPVAYLTSYLQNFMYHRKPVEVEVHSGSNKTSSTVAVNSNASPPTKFTHLANADANAIELDAQSLPEDSTPPEHMEERDEHGQSMLHFACARSHRRGALYTLIEESHVDITYRDELYRTARDVALQANHPTNAAEIDRFVLAQAVVGDVHAFEQLALQGYDHILDVEDESGKSIVDVAAERQNEELVQYLRNLRSMEESREELHQTIRDNNMERIRELTAMPIANWLIKTKNYYGRTALHIAVLKESEDIVQHFVDICPEALKVNDNLERTVLHYAMGTNALESLSRILIQNGAKRTAKDLKGRQPSYYFINKADILRLQEEEDESR